MLSGMAHSELGWAVMMMIAFAPIFLIAVALIIGKPKLTNQPA